MLEQECKKEEKELFGGRDRKNHGPFFACDGTVTTVFWSRMMLMSSLLAERSRAENYFINNILTWQH